MTVTHGAAAAMLVALAAACARQPARLETGDVTIEPPGASGAAVARVPVRNTGARPLLLHGARVECGCRLAAPLPDALAAGERVTVAVRCRSGGDGARAHELHLMSNDPERADVVVPIVLPPARHVAVDPPALYFGYVALGTSATRDLALPAGGTDVAPTTTDPALALEARPPRPDGSPVVRVRFTPRAPGPFHGALAAGGTADAVPVSGVGYRSILAFPAEVALPSELTTGAPPPVVLKAVGAAPVEITRVDLPPGIVGELQTTAPGREFRLLLRTRGRIEGEEPAIRLHTSDPEEPLVTIPVRGGGA